MFVSFSTEWHLTSYYGNFSVYEMKMNGLGERKLVKNGLKGLTIMCYDRDSKTLFISAKNSGYILSYSPKGLHSILYKYLSFGTYRWNLKYICY